MEVFRRVDRSAGRRIEAWAEHELDPHQPAQIDIHRSRAQPKSMIRALAKTTILFVAMFGVLTSGWACGLTVPDRMPGGQHAVASVDGASAMPDNPMKDCQNSETAKSGVPAPCFALCAITINVTPALAGAVAVQIGEPHYPAAPSIYNWLVQPEPYPPRA